MILLGSLERIAAGLQPFDDPARCAVLRNIASDEHAAAFVGITRRALSLDLPAKGIGEDQLGQKICSGPLTHMLPDARAFPAGIKRRGRRFYDPITASSRLLKTLRSRSFPRDTLLPSRKRW